MSPSSRIRSGRMPFGRSLKVGGITETRVSQIVPGAVVEMTKRLAVEGAAVAPVFSTAVYFFHSMPGLPRVAAACTVAPSLLSMPTVKAPSNPAAALA